MQYSLKNVPVFPVQKFGGASRLVKLGSSFFLLFLLLLFSLIIEFLNEKNEYCNLWYFITNF